MDKCDQRTAVECVDRIMDQFEKPIGLDSKARIQEMQTLFGEHSVQAVRSATNMAIRKFKKLPTVAHLVELLENEQTRVDRINRHTQYQPPQIEKRYVRDGQTREERTEFLNATLKKYGFGPVGSVLRKM